MGASTSVNNQTFNINGNNNSLTSTPKITSSLTVPVDVTESINPNLYYDLDDQSFLADLATAHFLAAVEGIDFETLIPTEEDILVDERLTEHLRLFGITPSTFKGIFKGFSSINVNTITSFTKSLSNILNVVSNSSQQSSSLKDLAIKIAPHAGKFLKELWDKRSGSKTHDATVISQASNTTQQSKELNDTTELITSSIITMPRLITISTADNPLHEQTVGSLRPSLQTTADGAPISKSDALLSNQMLVPFATTVNALGSIATCSAIAENLEITAKAVAASVSGSSPNITVTPPNSTLIAALNSTPISHRGYVRETVALAGSSYGLSIDGSESRSGSTNTLQDLINNTPIPGKQGMTLKNVSMMKREYYKNFDNYDIEVLVSDPEKVNLTDSPNTTFISNQHWLEYFSPLTTQRSNERYTRYFVNNGAMSAQVPNRKIFEDVPNVDESISPTLTPILVHDYNYAVDNIYSEYSGTITMIFSCYTDSQVTDVRNQYWPGLFVVPKGMTEVVFLPARPIDDGNTSFRLSFNTSNVSTDTSIFGSTTKGIFTFGIAGLPLKVPDIRAGQPLFTIEISDASVNLSRTTSSPTLGSWIFNREKVYSPLLSFVNAIHPGILESRSATDVNVFWQRFCSKYVPYVNAMIHIAQKPEFSIYYGSMQTLLRNCWDNDRDKSLPSLYNINDFDSVRTFCIDAILQMNTWLYYSADNVFDYVLPEHRIRVAWRLLTFLRSLIPICVYNTTSAQTILSAWDNITKITSSDTTYSTSLSMVADTRLSKYVLPKFRNVKRDGAPNSLVALAYNSRGC